MFHSRTCTNTRLWNSTRKIAQVILLILIAAVSQLAQEGKSPDRGFRPAGSYSIGDIETISMNNGNVMFHLPLGSLPPGRGGLSAGIQLTYSSKLWNTWILQHQGFYSTGEPGVWPLNILAPVFNGGWKYSFSYQLATDSRLDSHTWETEPRCPYPEASYILKFKVIFPDGSEHYFRPVGFSESPYLNDGYFQIAPDGWGYTCNGTPPNYPATYTSVTANRMTYYSTDGSYLRLDIDHDSDQNYSNNPWTLSFPDGRRVTGGNAPQRIYDRNNNYVEIQNITYNSHPATKLVDQLNRSVIVEYDYDANRDYVYTTGYNNEPLMSTIKWKTADVSKLFVATDDPSAPVGPQPLNASLRVVDQIILPAQAGGLAYTFNYNNSPLPSGYSNGWGEVSSVTLPSGAQTSYQFLQDGQNSVLYEFVLNNAPTRKDLTYLREYDGSSTPTTESWTYSFDPYGNPGGSVTGPDGGIYGEAFNGVGGSQPSVRERWDYGLSLVTIGPDGTKTERLWRPNRPYGAARDFNPYVKTEFTSIKDAAGNYVKTAIRDYTRDKNGSVTSVIEYDWVAYSSVERDANGSPTGVIPNTTVKRITNSSYHNPTPDASDIYTDNPNVYHKTTAPAFRAAIAATEVNDGTQTLSRAEFFYDDPSTTGNVTQQRSWDSTKGGYGNPLSTANSISVAMQYNQYGMPTLTTDARGFQTEIYYGQVGSFIDLYPTQIKTPFQTSVQRTETRQYDFGTGLVTRVTDVDNNVSSATTYDVFGRPILVKAAEDKPEETRTATEYSDANRRVILRSDLNGLGDGKLVSIQHYDQLGRIRLARQLEDASNANYPYDETVGIKVQTRYMYSGSTSYVLTSNAYRAAYSSSAGSEVTMGWNRSKSDNGGRLIEVQTFGGATLPEPWGGNGTGTGAVTTLYDANEVTVTDQALKKRKSLTDGLGRLSEVYEDPNGLNYLTSYAYNALGNLTKVYQGSQERTFAYSSLSRLLSAQNPESGTVIYTYDDNGNLATKTDARGVVTTFGSHDGLNRPTTRIYSDGTPPVTYNYDTATNGKGRLASVVSSVSSYSYSGYDALGRPLGATQSIGLQSYSISDIVYDRAGHVTSMRYPSNRIVNYGYDAAGRTSSFIGNLGDGNSRNYSTGISYAPSGAMSQEQFGTNVPIYNKLFYNSRGQLAEIRAGLTPNDTSWQRGAIINFYDTCWGMCNYNGVSQPMPINNGSLRTQQVFIPRHDNAGYDTDNPWVFSQGYDYDSLNRLKSVQEGSWWQRYDYDRYGNRTIDFNGTTEGIPRPQFDVNEAQSTNRLYAPGDTSLPMGQRQMRYDAAGNLTYDIHTGHGARTYDAENRMTASAGVSPASYVYDADGRRVKRIVGSTETWQVYGLDGELLAEYAANASPLSPQKEYGYRNGQLLITATPGTADWGPPPSYTPPVTLVPGLEIKLEHLTELRTAVNQLRQHAGLPNFNFTVDPEPERYVTTVKADHIRQLRQALEQARTQLGLPIGGYDHPTLTENQSWIYAIDFQEIRNQIANAWNSGTGMDIRWLVADQLGTPRIIFDQSGWLATTSRHDYLPFGEELFTGTAGRTTVQGYTSGPYALDGARQKFTSKERDNETDLDYSVARYYASMQGRFTSVDALLSSGIPGEPQSWNRYSYTINNPLKYIDPSGLIWVYLDSADGKTRNFRWYADPNDVPKGWTEYTGAYYDGADGRYYLNPNGPEGPIHKREDGLGFNYNWDPYVRNGWMKGPTPEQYDRYMKSGAVADQTWDIIGLLLLRGPKGKAAEAGLSAKATAEALEAIPVSNPALQRTINYLFKPTDRIPGGTAGAVRHELSTGELVGGKSHLRTASERIQNLRNVMRRENLSPADRATAQRYMHDLQDALKTKRK